jgi:hypothetical protein
MCNAWLEEANKVSVALADTLTKKFICTLDAVRVPLTPTHSMQSPELEAVVWTNSDRFPAGAVKGYFLSVILVQTISGA